jgi:hypothetical protein
MSGVEGLFLEATGKLHPADVSRHFNLLLVNADVPSVILGKLLLIYREINAESILI